jgi:uncharacterized protein involved in outer membrane biogenesis
MKVSNAVRIGLAALVAVVLALGAAELSGWRFLQAPLQRALSSAAGVPVQLQGDFRARLLWHPQIEVDHLLIAAANGTAAPHLLDAQHARLEWRWLDIWRWRLGGVLRVEALVVESLDAWLVRDAEGRASWQLGAPQQPAVQPDLPRFGRLELQRGTLLVDDRVTATKLKVEVANASPTRVHLTAGGSYHQFTVQAQVDADGPLPLLSGDDPKARVRVVADIGVGRARIAFDGQASALLGDRLLDGQLHVRGPSLASVGEPLHLTLPNTAPFDLQGRIGHRAGIWTLRADSATIGKSRLEGDFVFDLRHATPLLRGRLMGPMLALADLGPVVGTTPAAGDAGTPAPPPGPKRVFPSRRFDLPSLRAMDADIDVAIEHFDFGSTAIAPMQHLRTQLHLAAGVLTLNQLQAQLAGGTVAGSSQLDATGDPALWKADLRFTGLDVAQWLRRLDAPASDKSTVRSYLTGALNGELQVNGQGRSTAEILGTLDGQARLQLQHASLSHLITEVAGLDLVQSLSLVITGDKPLPLRCAYGSLALKNGVATVQNAALDNSDSTIRVTGQMNLRNETLTLVATVFPKDFSLFTLRSPVLVQGTFAEPAIHLDKRGIGARALAAAALAALLPPAALLAFVDTGEKTATDPCPAGTPR